MYKGFQRGLSFNASSTKPNDESKTSRAPAMSMNSLANAMNDDYSDIEEEDEAPDGSQEDDHSEDSHLVSAKEDKGSSRMGQSWLNSAPSAVPSSMPDLARYGIGAQLMLKMGYQKGKGLGVNSEGIVNPIETKQRPQGLGVGGVREKVGTDDFSSSSDEEDDTKPKHIEKPEFDLFSLIEDLEMKGVDVPTKYKELSDSKRSNDGEIVESFQKLKLISDSWESLTKQERFLQYQKDSVSRELQPQKQDLIMRTMSLQLLKEFQTDIDMSFATPDLIDATRVTLDKLVDCQKSNNTQSFDIIISLLASVVPTLMARFDILDNADNDELVMALADWCNICKKFVLVASKTRLNLWDSLIYESLSLKIDEILGGEGYSPSKHQDLLDFLDFWFNSPILIDAIATLGLLVRAKVTDFLETQIDHWNLHEESEFTPSHYVIDLGNSLLWKLDSVTYSSVLHQINGKFGSFFNIEDDKSMWSSLDSDVSLQSCLKNGQDKIKEYFDTWRVLFTSLLDSDASNKLIEANTNILRSSLIQYSKEQARISNGPDKATRFLLSLVLWSYQSGVIFDREQLLIWSQLANFNPRITALVRLLNSETYNSLSVAGWVESWVKSIQECVPESNAGDFLEMADWYVDVCILLINDRASMPRVKPPELPSLEGESTPSPNKILQCIRESTSVDASSNNTHTNVEGIPSYKLMTTFKDVVVSYCSLNDILFHATSKTHPTLGLPLYQLELKSGNKRDAYIQDDVLWLSNSTSFEPISVNSLGSLS